jgi:hypothetical protein
MRSLRAKPFSSVKVPPRTLLERLTSLVDMSRWWGKLNVRELGGSVAFMCLSSPSCAVGEGIAA